MSQRVYPVNLTDIGRQGKHLMPPPGGRHAHTWLWPTQRPVEECAEADAGWDEALFDRWEMPRHVRRIDGDDFLDFVRVVRLISQYASVLAAYGV